ncbi:MAG TPA: DUF4340 domain-containing protein [Oligoflexia bacterium]|nr:DUF4340 domain-containing protein [Oligoflexia bacterium]HMP48541.1 DUF4340 domain-containing protein [Oligoflexia bacterium]
MKKKLIVTGFVFILLLFVLYYLEFISREVELDKGSEREIFLSLIPADKITRLRLISGDGSIDITRSEAINISSPLVHRSSWILKDPSFAPASDEVVGELLSKIMELGAVRADIEEEGIGDLDVDSNSGNQYGLTPPDMVLIIDSDEVSRVISFGSKSKISGKRFVQVEGDPDLYLGSFDFPRYYSSIRERIKSREVLKIDPFQIVGIDVLEGSRFFRLYSFDCSSGEDSWRLKTGGSVPAKVDGDFVLRKLKELSLLKVRRIFEDGQSIYQYTGLESPFLIINMALDLRKGREAGCQPGTPTVGLGSDSSSQELLLQFGKGIGFEVSATSSGANSEDNLQVSAPGVVPTQSYFLKIGGERRIYEVEKSFIADWLQGGDHFRSRKPFNDLSVGSIEEIEVLVPESGCTIMATGESVSGFSSSLREIQDVMSKFKLDAVILPEELDLYPPIAKNGIRLATAEGSYALRERSAILAEDSGDGAGMRRPSVVEIERPSEEIYYGVLGGDDMSGFDGLIGKICAEGLK